MIAGSALRRDEGFTIAEVVMAAAILFFVLTAMIGLIGASQTMSVMAKDRTTVTNAMAEHIDHIRALDYYMIATPPGGSVPLSQDTTYGAYTVHFTNRVVFPDSANGEYLRSVYVKASCSIRGRTYRTSATVHIRNPRNDTTAASIGDPDAPEVAFMSTATNENAILYGKLVHPSGTAIQLTSRATSENDKVVDVRYILGVSGNLVKDDAGTFGHEADFPFTPGITSANTGTRWDTTQSGVRDGLQKIVVQALDSQGRSGTAERQFVVDNLAPAPVSSLSVESRSSTSARASIGAAADPPSSSVSYAVAYPYSLRKEPASGGAQSDWPASNDSLSAGASYLDAMFNAGPLSINLVTEPFSRYRLDVTAASPRDLRSAATARLFVSPPETYSGTADARKSMCRTEYVKSGNKMVTRYVLTIYLTTPTFPVSATATTYKFYACPNGSTGWSELAPTSAPVVTVDGSYWKINCTLYDPQPPRNLWFKVAANVTPLGESPAGFVTSNAIGMSPIDPSGKDGTSVTAQIMPDTTWSR